MGPGESRLLQVTGTGGVPADATAVVLNVTAVGPTAAGWLTVYPADAPLPLASNVNFSAGQTVPNSVQVKLGAGAQAGQIKIFNSAGQTHVIVDVGGYFRGHDHDDRYYTKAQAQARLAANSMSCPAGSFLGSVAADGTPTCGVGAQGPAGPQGPQGIQGPAGVPGVASSGGWVSVPALQNPEPTTILSRDGVEVTVQCFGRADDSGQLSVMLSTPPGWTVYDAGGHFTGHVQLVGFTVEAGGISTPSALPDEIALRGPAGEGFIIRAAADITGDQGGAGDAFTSCLAYATSHD